MDQIQNDVRKILLDLKNKVISFDQKTILVTGGAGFVGSWLCEILVRQGAHVICLDNLSSGLESNILHLKQLDNFHFIHHDISTPIKLKKNIDIVMHFASRASPLEFSKFPFEILKANIMGTWVCLDIAKENNARFILASTSEVYGDPDANFVPTPEFYYGNVNPIGVRSCYDESKRVAETITTAYHNQYRLDTRIIRIHNTFGPRMRGGDVYGRVITRFFEQALTNKSLTIFGDGTQTRSFTYISDLIFGILQLSYKNGIDGEVLNLGSDNETSINELSRKIIHFSNSQSKLEFCPFPQNDPKRRCPDLTKVKSLIKWEDLVGLDESLLKMKKWYDDTNILK